MKKTDPHDARALALCLSKDMLPEVRMKDKENAQLASLIQTGDTLVKLRTALKEVLELPFDEIARIELRVIVDTSAA